MTTDEAGRRAPVKRGLCAGHLVLRPSRTTLSPQPVFFSHHPIFYSTNHACRARFVFNPLRLALAIAQRLTRLSLAATALGPPSPSLSSTAPQGKGAVGGAAAKGASEESQRPEYFSGKDGEQGKDYNDDKAKAGSQGGEHPAEKAAEAAEVLNKKADEDKACVSSFAPSLSFPPLRPLADLGPRRYPLPVRVATPKAPPHV